MTSQVHASDHYQVLSSFGDNPGELSATFHHVSSAPALVVLLHGCTQNAQELASDSDLAKFTADAGFDLLMPQQSSNNNMQTCFNWYSTDDQQKDKGETASIVNMITTLNQRYAYQHIFMVGLSAGAAMADSIASQYPELFSAVAVVDGIPYACADSLIKAISCMNVGPSESGAELAQAFMNKQDSQTTAAHWPDITVVVGMQDSVVKPNNSKITADKWATLKQLSNPIQDQPFNTVKRQRWSNKEDLVELISISGMDHGWPVTNTTNKPFILSGEFNLSEYLLHTWTRYLKPS